MKDSFRIIMPLVAHFDLELHQMDIKIAFLNGDIDEYIYMSQPPNYESDDSKQMVSRTSVSSAVFQISSSNYLIRI
jgi:Reverse transcriptase (RNA-dependent DNA polymerase)